MKLDLEFAFLFIETDIGCSVDETAVGNDLVRGEFALEGIDGLVSIILGKPILGEGIGIDGVFGQGGGECVTIGRIEGEFKGHRFIGIDSRAEEVAIGPIEYCVGGNIVGRQDCGWSVRCVVQFEEVNVTALVGVEKARGDV